MPFTKLKSDEMNGGAFAADLEGTAFWQETLAARLAAARQERDDAIAELESGDSKEARAAQLAEERAALAKAEKAVETATAALAAARKTAQENRDALGAQQVVLQDAQSDQLACYEALSKAHPGAGAPPELTPKEVEWLSSFTTVSDTPPSETMTLQTDLQAAMLDVHAEQRKLDAIEAAFPDLADAVHAQEAALEEREEDVKDKRERIRAREMTNEYVNRLASAVALIEVQLEGTTQAAVSMPVVLLPFHRLVGELQADLDGLAGEDHVSADFTEAVAAAQTRLDDWIAKIADLEKLTGDAMTARLGEIDALGAALNALADDLEALRAEALPKARMDKFKADAAAELAAFSRPFAHGAEFLREYAPKLEKRIEKVDVTDADAAATEVERVVSKVSDLLEGKAVAKLEAIQLRDGKKALFDAEFDNYQKAVEKKQIKGSDIYDLRQMMGPVACTLEEFDDAITALKAKCLDADARADAAAAREAQIANGTILTVDQWRGALELPSGGYDLKYKIKGTLGDRGWEVHLTLSGTSILRRTEGIVMTGANRDAVYNALLIAPLDWRFRVHATFRMDDEEDAPSHVYLGENWVYRDYNIPAPIRAARVADMQRLIAEYEVRCKAAIAQRIK